MNYIKKLNKKPEVKSKMLWLYAACTFYGAYYLLYVLVNVSIIIEYGSNFSLGLLTTIFAIASTIVLVLMSKFTKPGKRRSPLLIMSVMMSLFSIIFAISINKFTLILYNLSYAICGIVIDYLLDVHRNSSLKEAGLYSEISEHQTIVELCFDVARIICFGILMVVGILRLQSMFSILIAISGVLSSCMIVIFVIYEHKFCREKATTNIAEKL